MSRNWNFRRGGGSNQKTLHGGSMDIFWNNTFYHENPFGLLAQCLLVVSFNEFKILLRLSPAVSHH